MPSAVNVHRVGARGEDTSTQTLPKERLFGVHHETGTRGISRF